ncbi:LacI family DNA-binding transcriptional regulator [Acetobacterium woodii]|uniref:HTH-type transcriptional regulator RegA n=1 Tax=Acetobacterium woodii (strain ATCC 29683 / DSM 1030 / JCM 2381 / KCTC 1655 / WB1) TaxID=931626 RepID=H6LF52_ACEWD|nr:LacI family DNA-binding transcriptional regulator [Acetobacterium woodii]AFA48152.1 HTH-type transcriptional regulator RegA [Acetobacterium woodii DSM 1030]
MRVKIVDVAREANVSVATVSRVVNNIPLVNEETKERVLEAIKKTGYKPNAIARSLKIQKTNTMGIMIPDITNPYYTEIVRGAEDVCGIYHYNIILSNTDFDPEKERKSLNVLVEKQCDGIIYVGKDLSAEMQTELIDAPSEVVLGCIPDDSGMLSGVLINNETAAYELATEIIKMGHQKFMLFFDELEEGYIYQERKKGFIKAFKENNIDFDDSRILREKLSLTGGYSMMEQALNSGVEFTCVFCFNDQTALGALRCAEEMGKKVPDDISVCGFNNFWIAEWTRPQITTVAQPMYDIGAIAMRMLIKLCEKDGDRAVKNVYVPHEVYIRDSVQKIK